MAASISRMIVVNEDLYNAYTSIENEIPPMEQRIWHGEGSPMPKNFSSFSQLIESAEDKNPPQNEIKDETPLGIIYTSGTTGPPKGAVISHFNYFNPGRVWVQEIIRYRDDDIFFTALPLFHANADVS